MRPDGDWQDKGKTRQGIKVYHETVTGWERYSTKRDGKGYIHTAHDMKKGRKDRQNVTHTKKQSRSR